MYLLINGNEWLMTLLFLIKNYQTTYNKKLLFQKIFCKTYNTKNIFYNTKKLK